MKTSSTLALIIALGTFAAAQTSAPPSATPAPSQSESPQTASPASNASAPVIGAVLTKTVDAKKVKEGDEVVAKTLMELKSADGTVIPKNSKIIGHITQAQARGKGQDKSVLGIAFDKLQAKDKELPFHAIIQAVAAPQPFASLASDNGMPSASGPGTPSTAGASGAAGDTNSNPNARDTGAAGNVGSNAGADTASAPPGSGDAGASLNANSQGVMGMKDVQLAATTSATGQASILSSNSSNVRLESGTRLVLKLTPQ